MSKTTHNTVQHVDAAQAAQLLEADSAIAVLDVRTGWEFNRGHIDGAILVNYLKPGFSSKVQQLDPELQYMVVCKSGHRSKRALSILKKAGFEQLIHLDGGMNGWRKANLKISR